MTRPALSAWLFPGQGSQRKGMAAELLPQYRNEVAEADGILGFSVAEACLYDNERRLQNTRYLQPVLFVVTALSYLEHARHHPLPDYLAGHSLGEYTALLAAGAFDLSTGLRIVRRRAELMGAASGGGMLAVVGPQAHRAPEILDAFGVPGMDVANHNAADQLVLAGPSDSIRSASKILRDAGIGRCVPLNVSAAFHSRYMTGAAEQFGAFLATMPVRDPVMPVISNVTARPYEPGAVVDLLVRQLNSPVRWSDSMTYLLDAGVREVTELGPGHVLSGLWKVAVEARSAITTEAIPNGPTHPEPTPASTVRADTVRADTVRADAVRADTVRVDTVAGAIRAEDLGSAEFRREYGVRYAYFAGSMYHGIASTELVARMATAGLLGFFGSGGLPLDQLAQALTRLGRDPGPGRFGANLLHAPDDPALEDATVGLLLRHDVRQVEAAGFTQLTPALVRYRLTGARLDPSGIPEPRYRIVAKVSRPEVAAAFMRPAPEPMVDRLLRDGLITQSEAAVAARLPVSGDVCVEADSGGHTDAGVAYVLLPAMTRLRDSIMAELRYPSRIRIGAAGGLGAPESVAAAFLLGAEFVVTGSVNQCTPEAGTSDAVKDLLAAARVQDTAYAPAGDMFELGARVQVLRRGTLFAARANKLYQVYRQYPSLDALEPEVLATIESYFGRSAEQVWAEVRQRYQLTGREAEFERSAANPKQRMAMVFRWYFGHTTRLALLGEPAGRVNFQVHTGPAIGAFNDFVRGTRYEDWRHRHVDTVAELLMGGAAQELSGWLDRQAGAQART